MFELLIISRQRIIHQVHLSLEGWIVGIETTWAIIDIQI